MNAIVILNLKKGSRIHDSFQTGCPRYKRESKKQFHIARKGYYSFAFREIGMRLNMEANQKQRSSCWEKSPGNFERGF
jgi:hypothetical protein